MDKQPIGANIFLIRLPTLLCQCFMSTPVGHVETVSHIENFFPYLHHLSALLLMVLNTYASMSVLVDGVRTARVVISPLLHQTTLSAAFVSSGLGCAVLGPSSVTIAVDCGPIESLSIRLPCALSFDQQTSVSLGVDWITSVHKWYLDHSCELPGGAFSLQALLYPAPIAASSAARITRVFNGSTPNPPTPPHPVGGLPCQVGASPAFTLSGSETHTSHQCTHTFITINDNTSIGVPFTDVVMKWRLGDNCSNVHCPWSSEYIHRKLPANTTPTNSIILLVSAKRLNLTWGAVQSSPN
ncbi:hypothetical protein B0H13DRAFT_1875055 [Mycena leptocephala]|nr:hypothetical protein B0H13DRAFT_1875055 [Mycena leptocephala]